MSPTDDDIKKGLRGIPKNEPSYDRGDQFAQKQDFLNQAREYKRRKPGCPLSIVLLVMQLAILVVLVVGAVQILRGL